MPNYTNSKIYAIRSPNTALFYVGATCNQLSKRLYQHCISYSTHAKQILEAGDSYIELIQHCPCSSKEELNSRLGYVLRKLNERYINNTQNRNVFYVTDDFDILNTDDLEEIEF